MTYQIAPRNSSRLLRAVLDYLPPNALMSLEGDLSDLLLENSEIVSRKEIGELKRNTLSPEQDFLVLEVGSARRDSLWRQIASKLGDGEDGSILHVLIACEGKCVFWAYDCFHSECVGSTDKIPSAFLENLKDKEVILSFGPANT